MKTDLTKTVIQDPQDWGEGDRNPTILGRIRCLWFRVKYGDRKFIKILVGFSVITGAGSLAISIWINASSLARNDWEGEHLARIRLTRSVLDFDGRFKPDFAEMGIASQATVSLAKKIRTNVEKASASGRKPCNELEMQQCIDAIVNQNFKEIQELEAKPSQVTFKVVLNRDELIALKSLRVIATDLATYPQVKDWDVTLDATPTLEALEVLRETRQKRTIETAESTQKPKRQSIGRRSKVANAEEE